MLASPFSHFIYALKAPETKRQYPERFSVYLDFVKMDGSTVEEKVNKLYERIKKEDGSQWFQTSLMEFFTFQKERAARKEVTGSTIKNYLKPLRLFCEMNSILVNWKLITRGLPRAKSFGDDRPPTMEEIQKLCEYPDKRIKPLVSLLLSSGIRIGAFEYLKWKHIIPLENGCAKIIVYAGEEEQYYSFVTLECYNYLQEYMKYRKSYGEEIGPESPVIRDLWQIKNRTYLEKNKLAKNAKPLGVNGVKSLLIRAWRDSGIRTESKTRHDFKLAHGFRKAFKTICENSDMKSINVEVLMGHTLGVTSSYYKPSESSILADYEKAVDNLTINEENRLRKEVTYLKIRQDRLEKVMDDLDLVKKQLGLNF